ncbi:unnamed protein product [Owenia fusiformis]|uniref:Ankyrin repeat protein n=1 Tax=Owenia fusiformis TaxID=6347 RepID=A0A8S4NU37_OWEFU|nr:unnamed protein product [Owenia fusiformis]
MKDGDAVLPTILMTALKKNRKEICRILIERGADINASDSLGRSALVVAAKHSAANFYFLISKGADVNVRVNDESETILMLAVKMKRLGFCRRLLEGGADLNAISKTGKTALIIAIEMRFKSCVRLLMDAGADVNIKECGKTAIVYAIEEFYPPSYVQAIAKRGADLNVTMNDGETLLMLAARNPFLIVLELIF